VATGAQIPPFFDAVVRKEDVARCENTSHGVAVAIQLSRSLFPGQNVRYRGSDVAEGQVILEKGTRLDLQHFPLLSALGIRELKVYRRPRVGILSSGNEVVDCLNPDPLEPGKVRNATYAFLAVILQSMGCDIVWFGNIRDNALEATRFLGEKALRECDILLTTGGVSVGQRDFWATTMENLGAEILFHHLSMRPGKPSMAAAVANGDGGSETLVIGLPGNPMATVSAHRFLVTPVLRKIFGMQPERAIRVRLGNGVVKPEGFTSFLLGKLSQTADGLTVFSMAEQESYRVLPLARANVWIRLPEVVRGGEVGDMVEVLPLFADGFSRTVLE
jgi:molybdopterin molybdotransferase